MRVFVAGGTGVIGRRAVPALLDAGHTVSVLSRTPGRRALIEQLEATPAPADLFDPGSLRAALAGHDAVVNLATHIPPISRAARRSSWAENDRIRTEGVANLVAAAGDNGVRRFVQESVTFAYADAGDDWIDETAARQPEELTASVDAAEDAARSVNTPDVTGVVLRFAQFYAPDASHTRVFARAFRWRMNPLVGDPDSYVSFIGTPAGARAVVAALDIEGGIYNVADDDPPTRWHAAGSIAAALGQRPPCSLSTGLIQRVNKSAALLARSQRVNNQRLRDAAGWAPDHAGADGIAAAVTEAGGRHAR